MEPYKYFGLSAPPFDGRPDPRFYYATSGHAETLATLQYAVHTRKSCTLILGDSGSGKTLLGRLLTQSLAAQIGVAWIHGIGQPDNRTDVTLCPPSRLARADPRSQGHARETTLTEWLRTDPAASRAGVVLVDNADGLRPHNWDDILALVTREIRSPRPVCLILLGLPGLVETLAGSELVRLQRRVFRACRLAPLARPDVDGYVRHRLGVAGAANQDTFTPAALDLVHRFSDGNPALLNQLCDNALVDAFADDRTQVDGRHVVATIHAITGGIRSRRYLPTPLTVPRSTAVTPVVTAACRAEARLRNLSTHNDRPHHVGHGGPTHHPVGPTDLVAEMFDPAPSANAGHTYEPEEFQAGPELAAAPSDGESPAPLDQRLRALESRLAEALSRVREARRRPHILPPPPTRDETWPNLSSIQPVPASAGLEDPFP